VRGDHINAGMMRILDRMEDTPAQVENILGETLKQTRPAVTLLGDETTYTGLDRSRAYRWFTNPAVREMFPQEDHDHHGRTLTAHLASVYAKTGKNSPAGTLVSTLRERSANSPGSGKTIPSSGRTVSPNASSTPSSGCWSCTGRPSSIPINSRRS
jgi:hypothetical protein